MLSFDKDDDEVMDFVAAVANLRAHCYEIPLQSRFKSKEMAGNIIPAIATTNAIIAGMIVMQVFKLLNDQLAECKNV
jgi:ubiquitin-like 1-activating enzyme E1 B